MKRWIKIEENFILKGNVNSRSGRERRRRREDRKEEVKEEGRERKERRGKERERDERKKYILNIPFLLLRSLQE